MLNGLERSKSMAFVRKITDEPVRTDHMRGGEGYVLAKPILSGREELYDKGRLFNHIILEPGCEIGMHKHEGEGETYYILKGKGRYYRGSETVEVGPGYVTFCGDGEEHGLFNDGPETLEMIALILDC